MPSDLVAGMALVRARQRQCYDQKHRSAVHAHAERVAPDDPDLEKLNYFAAYAFAVYGCLMSCAMHPCGGCRVVRAGIESGDFDGAALRRDAKSQNVVFESHVSSPNERVPTVVFVDDARPAIVVALRGTMSIEDCLSDASANDAPLDDDGFPGRRAHAGVAGIARATLPLLLKPLDAAVARQPDYEVVCVGHSLGGGVAQVLSLFLTRARPKWRVSCVAYEPPGATVDAVTAAEMTYALSSVLADDAVPRLGLPPLFRLRDDCVDALAHCKVPKWRALETLAFWRPDSSKLFWGAGDPEKMEAEALSAACAALLKEEAREDVKRLAPLTIPGTVAHLVVRKGSYYMRGGWDVVCYRTPRDHFAEIIVSATMLTDHFPWRVAHALRAAARGKPEPGEPEPAPHPSSRL